MVKRLYLVRHFIEASSVKEAIRLTQKRQPEDVYVAEEWITKVGYLEEKKIKGFGNGKE